MNLIRRSSLLLCLLCVGWPEPVAAAPSAEEQELGAKLDRIDELRDRETGPGLLMAGISSALTPDLWLTELRQDGPQQFVLEGFAFSDEAVTGLVTRLEEADRFTNAELVVLGRGTFAKQELTRFIITFTHLLTPRGGGERRDAELPQDVDQRLERLQERLSRALREMPSDREIPELERRVRSIAEKIGLEVHFLKPQPEVKQGFYADVPVALQFQGSFHEIAVFLDRLGKLNRLINVEDLAVHYPVEQYGKVVLVCEVTLVTYRFLARNEAGPEPESLTRYVRVDPVPGEPPPNYNPIGARDPFRWPLQYEEAAGDPLQRFDIDEHQLVAVVPDRALLRDPLGELHIVEVGTVIGKGWGKVTEIHPTDVGAMQTGSLLVVEEYRDPIENQLIINEITMGMGCW